LVNVRENMMKAALPDMVDAAFTIASRGNWFETLPKDLVANALLAISG
jgi:hypothetical protein